jgi:hypothetical protein
MDDRERIHFLASHYSALQGLRFTPFWLFFALSPWRYAMPDHRPTFVRDYTTIAMLLFCIAWAWLAGKFYRARYGSVQSKPQHWSHFLFAGSMLVAYLWCYLADEKNPPVSFVALWWGCFLNVQCLWTVGTESRRIAYTAAGISMLLLALVPVTGLISTSRLLSVDHPSGSILLGTIMLAMGIFDHFELLRLLSPASGSTHA